MPVPETAGWYWWLEPDSPAQCVEVWLRHDRLWTWLGGVRTCPIEDADGTWGERIPSNAELVALREENDA